MLAFLTSSWVMFDIIKTNKFRLHVWFRQINSQMGKNKITTNK